MPWYLKFQLRPDYQYLMNVAMHQIIHWMDSTCLMELMVITSILGHEVIIGCGILAFLTMEAGK